MADTSATAPVVVGADGSQAALHAAIWDAVLLDGSTVSLRRLDSGDFDEVVGLAGTLTQEECYRRFFTLHPTDLDAWARSLTERSSNQFALGAFDSGTLIGIANYFACQPPGYAEVAVVVAHNEHLRGVGTALLRQLGLVARQNGLHHFIADVLADNSPMFRLLSDAGWRYKRHLDGSVLEVDFDLDNADRMSGPQGHPSRRKSRGRGPSISSAALATSQIRQTVNGQSRSG